MEDENRIEGQSPEVFLEKSSHVLKVRIGFMKHGPAVTVVVSGTPLYYTIPLIVAKGQGMPTTSNITSVRRQNVMDEERPFFNCLVNALNPTEPKLRGLIEHMGYEDLSVS